MAALHWMRGTWVPFDMIFPCPCYAVSFLSAEDFGHDVWFFGIEFPAMSKTRSLSFALGAAVLMVSAPIAQASANEAWPTGAYEAIHQAFAEGCTGHAGGLQVVSGSDTLVPSQG